MSCSRVLVFVLAVTGLGAVSNCATPSSTFMSRKIEDVCERNIKNANDEVDSVCMLALADEAHQIAGRAPISSANCASWDSPCGAPDSSLLLRVLMMPATFESHKPQSVSIEATGFDSGVVRVSEITLTGSKPFDPDQPYRGVMRVTSQERSVLSPDAARSILELATKVRKEPEQSVWRTCVLPEERIIVTTDSTSVFVQLFFGREEHAYARSWPGYGDVGQLAEALLENRAAGPYEGPCLPNGRKGS